LRYIIGIGHASMSDDGVGLRVVERLARDGLEQGFEAVSLAGEGLRLLSYFTAETEKIVLVDAVEMGLAPGDWRVFRPEDVQSVKISGRLTTHEGDILKVLELGRRLGTPAPLIVILGIQPGSLGPGLELSPALAQRLDTYISVALTEIATLRSR
jgi:hydrogenase maturation protease